MANGEKLDLTKLQLSIDIDGHWRHEGVEITHPRILALLYLALQKQGPGYFVCADGLCVPVTVADCPFAVLSVRHLDEGVQLTLSSGEHAWLDPATLSIDAENVPRCQVRADGCCARFSRAAWHQLAEAIEETAEGGFVLQAAGKGYPIKTA
jgi:hypothetical protein